MWISEITTTMEVKRQDGYTVSLLQLKSNTKRIRYYSLIHKDPIGDEFKQKLNGMPNTYNYMTEKQARDRFRLLVATPVQITDNSKPVKPKSLREQINEQIS
jgi:hypothetical protein